MTRYPETTVEGLTRRLDSVYDELDLVRRGLWRRGLVCFFAGAVFAAVWCAAILTW